MCFFRPFSIVMVFPMAHPICDFRWDGRNSWRRRGTGPGVPRVLAGRFDFLSGGYDPQRGYDPQKTSQVGPKIGIH